ncbi:MAG: sensor histidine kinase [Chloroflexi bacterium]|nr:sensor histidine kinase [Chloroflexota bacterium]
MQKPHDQGKREKAWEAVNPGRAQPTDAVIASSGVTFHLWRLYQHFWLVCLLFPLISFVSEPLVPWRLAPGVVALLFFATSYTWIMWPHPVNQRTQARARSRLSFLLFVALSLQVTVFSLVYGPAWLWLFIGVSAIAGILLPMRSAGVAVVLFTLLPLFITISTHGGIVGVDWWWLIALMLLVRGLGLDMIGVARMGSAIRELHAAQRELARLKVEEERLRLARDLHDLLGQTLSLIALKSKLAGRLIEQEPTQAAQEIREVERIARQTLREVREAVAGYRQPTLANEVDGAQQLLEAAGIACSLEYSTLALPPGTEAVLAWTVREGVTNVIRHSRAQHCVIRLLREHNMVYAEVSNDGEQRERTEGTDAREGLGLSGLTERVTSLGGRIEAAPVRMVGKTGFRLWVELPLQSHGGRGETVQEEQS